MFPDAARLDHLRHQGLLLHAGVLTRDNAHLGPRVLSRAAAARLRQGLRRIEAWLRRVILLLALALEPGLKPRGGETVLAARPRRPRFGQWRFRVLTGGAPPPGHAGFWPETAGAGAMGMRGLPVAAMPLLARLAALKALIEAPEARARRLAWLLARRKPGLLLAPGKASDIPGHCGTEISSLYAALAPAIITASRARPPPLGRRPRPAPRIRQL